MMVITACLFFIWILVAMETAKVEYAIWVSVGVIGAWLVVAIGRAIAQKGISLESDRAGEEYRAESFGVMAAVSPNETGADTPEKLESEGEPPKSNDAGAV